MLVRYKVFKKIKLGFLLVGHTHDQIDQMFSRFSTKLGKSKAFTYKALSAIILESYMPAPVITLLQETYDFRTFAFGEPKIIIDNLHNIKFQHQYKICRVTDDDVVPRMWAKKFSTSEVWKPKNGVKLLKDEIPQKIMSASLGMGLVRKGDRMDEKHNSKVTPADVLETSLAEVEKGILACERYLTADDMDWWKIFFEEQRVFNIALLAEARPLKEPFHWPRSRDDPRESEEIPQEDIDLDAINSRVYGPDREIYVGPYRSQRDLDREKENLEGDFSDLVLDTFLCVASDDINTPFWLAKVEKIVSYDEKNIPEVVSVLWHALKKDADPFHGKYLPEVLDYEKKKSGKGKGTKQPIWHHAEINLKETTIYAYNFFLKKSDIMYLNTVKRIKIKLREFEDDTTEIADIGNERGDNENEREDRDDRRSVESSSSEGDSIPYSLD